MLDLLHVRFKYNIIKAVGVVYMIFYEIEILSVPEIIFAYSVEIEKYKNRFEYMQDFLEIALCERGRILFEHDSGEKEIVHPGMAIPIFSDIACRTASYENEKQRHTTVGVSLKYHLKRYNSEKECDILSLKERMKNSCSMLIPYHCYMDDKFDEIMNILKKIIALHSSENPYERISAISQWFLLGGALTNFVLEKLNNVKSEFPPSELFYADKAVGYIHRNYMNKLTVKEISAQLGISEGYLHRIFRDIKGTGVLEYINRHRVSTAIELIENKNVTLKEAAYNVGIEDPAYMSRIFKKITGLSYREYFRQKKIQ